jgi:hypothetical protein
MDILLLALLLSIGIFVLNGKQQRQRIGLLASHLAQYQIEKLMENLIEGYHARPGRKRSRPAPADLETCCAPPSCN